MRVNHSRGFSLIELIVAVAIIAILAAVAVPSYQKHVEKTRRTQAQADLLELAQWLQRNYSKNTDYRGTGGVPPVLPFNNSPREAGEPTAYRLAFAAAPSQNRFTLVATPTALQSGDDCGSLTLAHTGERRAQVDGCW